MDANAIDLRSLPGGEIVVDGLADLEHGRDTVSADAVLMAAGRLREAGIEVPGDGEPGPASHRLYAKLATEQPRGAHSRYNAIARRMVSFARAAEHARRR
jgi:hypothetical protein